MHPYEIIIALNTISGLGPVQLRRMLMTTSPQDLRRQIQSKSPSLQPYHKLLAKIDWDFAQKEYFELKTNGLSLISINDPNYPDYLKHIYDPPPLIYLSGTLTEKDSKAIAIVGSRKCSFYGERQAYRFGRELAQHNITVVSGLARGIDIAAHKGALAAKGRTIAVLGSGLKQLYPKEHWQTAQKITQNGACCSEFSLYTPPLPHNFPRRNRVICGLSMGVIVVEAGKKSGALITAQFALEQGREVFAVPGNLDQPLSIGPHQLIQQGAKLITCIDDVLEEIPALASVDKTAQTISLNEPQILIWSVLGEIPKSMEMIVIDSKLPAHIASSELLALELKGVVAVFPGKRFARCAGWESVIAGIDKK